MTKYAFAIGSVLMLVIACVTDFLVDNLPLFASQTAFAAWMMATACWFTLNDK